MGFFDRFRKPALYPASTRRRVRDEPGPLTAREAWTLVKPVIRDLDPHARLTLLTSGLDISPEGRSFIWEFGWDGEVTTAFAEKDR